LDVVATPSAPTPYAENERSEAPEEKLISATEFTEKKLENPASDAPMRRIRGSGTLAGLVGKLQLMTVLRTPFTELIDRKVGLIAGAHETDRAALRLSEPQPVIPHVGMLNVTGPGATIVLPENAGTIEPVAETASVSPPSQSRLAELRTVG
jgi:hypothetical protein